MAETKSSRKSLMRISAAAAAAGVSKQTVEYYILIGLVRPIRRGDRGRFFDNALVARIRLIRRLNESGYTLRAIRETYLRDR
ncbi:MAG TPA: MerR family transcriptional regulator [Phycisphaerae bacterium]|nr:MerR family transcriptional regulator [Phycisphaerae bacterium]